MTSAVFRIFNPKGPKEDATGKRRAQLRRAQKSYRDRKEIYTKSLEVELAQTRAREADLSRECEHLRNTIQELSHLMSHHGISTPAGLVSESPKEAHLWSRASTAVSPHSVADETGASPSNNEHNAAPEPRTDNPLGQVTTLSAKVDDGTTAVMVPPFEIITSRELLNNQFTATTETLRFQANGATRVCELDAVAVGMEFVLTIERPCLDHLHGDPEKPEKPNGHALTASAQLYAVAPDFTGVTNYQRWASQEAAPIELLSRLLSLSSNLCADDELTPAQAWNHVRGQPQFGGLDIRKCQALANKLREAVKCHGFGAVIDRKTFDSLVFDALILGQDF
ncbi:uncharacterized protein CTRU02_213449 [Colletotrichum truncatum]|uniref:Uncharacterized protein n=1 Tax=Colletotrichum truncatum TaxID=5467 RepID=A0ACC3YLA1_COLTU|nr:uncharacterized protein CTRU02_13443 [Colletotrichum truncatum]KAF6783453.1 hypothetical protein CTRU02_13443 [Colletotrichum truncatum]